MIGSSGGPCDTVLDLFAGSGALGIEALSRGASWADFVDNSRECCTMIRQNLERTGFSERAAVHCIAASHALQRLQRQYDVVFVDPPYDDPSTDSVVAGLAGGRLLSPDALVIVSHGNRHPLADSHGNLVNFKSRRYGDTFITIYHREEQ
jgi:16S rRNA (guanine(966)-N(2))-methyltransferase RsmD